MCKADRLTGWDAICAYAGCSRPTAIKYGLPVYRGGKGMKVYAMRGEVAAFIAGLAESGKTAFAIFKPTTG